MKRLILTLSGLVLLAPAAARAAADELDAGFRAAAPQILNYLEKKNCENFGVLKFLVDKGDGNLTDNVGSVNRGVADRLEVALILALKDDRTGVIYRASDVAAKISGANHLDPTGAGRRALFGRAYPLAWGPPDQTVKADQFLTGTVVISKDLKKTTVTVQAFGADGKLDEKVAQFAVDTPTRLLTESGRSYLITPKSHPQVFARGLIEKDEIKKTVVDQNLPTSTPNGTPPPPPPSLDRDAPVKVAVLVNGRKVDVTEGSIPEPKVGDKVEFLLENTADAPHGVVLKVNGENTIFRERFDAKDCYKWILKPGEKIYVSGFQQTDSKRDEFRVLAYEESKANEVSYGPNLGTIEVTVFRGDLVDPSVKPAVKPEPKEEDLVVAAISRGAITFNDDGRLEDARPGSLGALKGKLTSREKNPTGSRGLLGTGTQTESAVKKATFESKPGDAIMQYTIKYYKSKKL